MSEIHEGVLEDTGEKSVWSLREAWGPGRVVKIGWTFSMYRRLEELNCPDLLRCHVASMTEGWFRKFGGIEEGSDELERVSLERAKLCTPVRLIRYWPTNDPHGMEAFLHRALRGWNIFGHPRTELFWLNPDSMSRLNEALKLLSKGWVFLDDAERCDVSYHPCPECGRLRARDAAEVWRRNQKGRPWLCSRSCAATVGNRERKVVA